MKHLILLIILGTSITVYAQKSPEAINVPAAVSRNFQQQFPGAADVKWKLKDNQYKAAFHKHDVWYDANGKLIKQKEDIKNTDLPTAIKQTVEREFTGYTIKDADKHTNDGAITYKLELKKETEERKVTFSPDGRVLENVANKEDKKNKKEAKQ
ncbi:PepSY-like domain-containing protein [Chitinophaga rhizophila]|uniref:Putative beta-lactamase-inhibitor-like PepSY-like domain-containing protein n=1 Tax=Chitinophaga rhizophila TaxID=2866212 RepID=A0ABS7GGI6_9BACT|nr:PepSY-like domain-containing protein [Chitinophaga rhizophila]MBW8686800.1 hypothetical protein [Chitinophaga rhizophila]